ncbi:MAG: sigma-70 family RNA polymerase sigma factor [bacterium]
MAAVPPSQPPDAELVNSAKSGNRHSFDQIVDRYFGLIYAVAYSRLRHRESAEDLAQEVFLRAYLNLDKVQQPDLIAGWLVRVAQHLAIDWIRQGNRRSKLIPMVPIDELVTDIPDTQEKNGRETMINLDQNQALQSALFRLPETQREMVLLHYAEGYSHRQIAKYLAIHPSNVGRQLRQALKSLQTSLQSILQETAPSFRPPRKVILRTLAIIGATAALSAKSKAALVTAAAGTSWIPAIIKSSSPGIIKTIISTLFSKQTLGLAGKGILVLAIGGGIFIGINKYLSAPPKSAGDKPVIMGVRRSLLPNDTKLAASVAGSGPAVAVSSGVLPSTENPALALLAKYQATQDKLQSFILKYEDAIERKDHYTSGPNMYLNGKQKRSFYRGELRSDGIRHGIQYNTWGELRDGFVPQETPRFFSLLWDGKVYIRYSIGTNQNNRGAYINTRKNEKWNKEIISIAYPGAMMIGYVQLNDSQRIDEILRQQQLLSVRTSQENINEVPCEVIDASGKYGKYTIWLDPQHDYQIAQMEVVRKEGDWTVDRPLEKGTFMRNTLKNVRFERIDDIWIPMEATIEESLTFPTGNYKYSIHHKLMSITLNPDFNALNAFVPNYIKDGTKVRFDKTGPNITYTWQNGAPVDKQGKKFEY